VRKHVTMMHKDKEGRQVDGRRVAAKDRPVTWSCPVCSSSFKSRVGLGKHKCRRPPEAAAVATTGTAADRPVILCLPDPSGLDSGMTARLCYAVYIGKDSTGYIQLLDFGQ